FFPADLNSIGFTDLINANYRLAASSPYKGAGTDGKDLGADIDALTAALANSTPPSQSLTVNITDSVTTGVAPLAVSFACTTADPAGQVTAYNWDFGDGQTATAPAVSHTYQTAGVCTARLTVTDNLGATASASVFINVTAPQAPP